MAKNKEQKAINKLREQIAPSLIWQGYINTALPWYSPKDLAKFLGKSRQYWCKLIKQGKLKSYKTSAGPIITTEQLAEYYELVPPNKF